MLPFSQMYLRLLSYRLLRIFYTMAISSRSLASPAASPSLFSSIQAYRSFGVTAISQKNTDLGIILKVSVYSEICCLQYFLFFPSFLTRQLSLHPDAASVVWISLSAAVPICGFIVVVSLLWFCNCRFLAVVSMLYCFLQSHPLYFLCWWVKK